MGAESDVVIFVASGKSAVSDTALVLGGGETGGNDIRALVVGDVVAAKEVEAWDELGLTVRIILLAFL